MKDYQNLINIIISLVKNRKIEWKKHALKRMLERDIKREEVFNALIDCEIIETHKTYRPLQSYLVLGYHNDEALHVMLAISEKEWQKDYKTRRKI